MTTTLTGRKMRLSLDWQIAQKYKSPSQRARVMTERWLGENIFCPNCGETGLKKHPDNTPAADFYCLVCHENYELKSKGSNLGPRILNGAYDAKIDRLHSDMNPNLFILTYQPNPLHVTNLLVIPKYFFIPKIIEKRAKLSNSARRAGWVGSIIVIDKIPDNGKIYIVKNEQIIPKSIVLAKWEKTKFLQDEKRISARGWLLDTMRIIDKLKKAEFSLDELYKFETELSRLYTKNKHIKAKIRQQLQILRDRGYLEFVSKGKYRLKQE